MPTLKPPADLLAIDALRPFVPATAFALSKAFYQTLGFTLAEDYGDVCEFERDGFRFLLQHFHAPDFANNFVMHLLVRDVDAWWQHIQRTDLLKHFPTARAQAPAMQPWGLKVLFLHDPSGVLWHIAQN
jgi:hypothetical protein